MKRLSFDLKNSIHSLIEYSIAYLTWKIHLEFSDDGNLQLILLFKFVSNCLTIENHNIIQKCNAMHTFGFFGFEFTWNYFTLEIHNRLTKFFKCFKLGFKFCDPVKRFTCMQKFNSHFLVMLELSWFGQFFWNYLTMGTHNRLHKFVSNSVTMKNALQSSQICFKFCNHERTH